MTDPPQETDRDGELARLAAQAREGDARGLEALCKMAKQGEELAVETLFILLREGVPGSLDSFIMVALKDQNLPARELLYDHLRSILKKWAKDLLQGQPSDLSDLAQSCIRRFLKRETDLTNLDGSGLLAYLRRMATNWAMDRHRERKRRRQVELGDGDSDSGNKGGSTGVSRVPEEILNHDFEVVISSLSPKDKAIVRMRFQQGLKYDEIGRQCDPPLSYHAVWMKLARILRRLRPNPE